MTETIESSEIPKTPETSKIGITATPIGGFENALTYLKQGKKVRIIGTYRPGSYLAIFSDNPRTIFICYEEGNFQWVPCVEDLLSLSWELVHD